MAIFRKFSRKPSEEGAAICDICKNRIYDDDAVYIIDGFNICSDCFSDFATDYFAHCRVFGEEMRKGRNNDT